jgi:arabinoxylan arabinofuranohydrolase
MNRIIVLFFLFMSIVIGNIDAQDPSIKYPYHFEAKGNPIITYMFTADPSPHVWADGQLWLYCSHDNDSAKDYKSMDAYHVFSTKDLIHWIDWGEVLNSKDVKWGLKGWMWAPDCAYKNGKYYFYFPHEDKKGQFRIGVAISDVPQGPFKPLDNYIEGTSGTDPCCFIDDDGQAYLYFGHAQVARLKENMTELAEKPRNIDYGATTFYEGSYMHKRNGIYYYSWTQPLDHPNQGFYAMGNNPYGPFKFMGAVNGEPPGAQDHHSMIEFKGKWYYFYHVGNYTGGSFHRRNVCIEYLYYNPDGTIKMVVQTKEGVKAAGEK